MARPRIGLALAGGGPFGAIYEIGALFALEESVEGLDLNRLDCYVGVSAGSFLAAALANGIPVSEMYRLFIAGEKGEGAVTPRLFMRLAYREYLRALSRGRIPTGLFDNRSIDAYLSRVFAGKGRSNDFRALKRRLYVVATDLDSGKSVSFGRPGPLLARHGLRLRREVPEDPGRSLRIRRKALSAAQEMRMTARDLRDTLADLRYSLARV